MQIHGELVRGQAGIVDVPVRFPSIKVCIKLRPVSEWRRRSASTVRRHGSTEHCHWDTEHCHWDTEH